MHADFFSHFVQHVMALLVWQTLSDFLFIQALKRALYIGRTSGRTFLYRILQHLPYFRELIPFSNMVGASASVLAIVLATAYREPNYPINLLLLEPSA